MREKQTLLEIESNSHTKKERDLIKLGAIVGWLEFKQFCKHSRCGWCSNPGCRAADIEACLRMFTQC